MLFHEFKDAVIAAANKNNIKDYELYYQSNSSDDIETFDKQVEKFASTVTQGVCFRCIINGKMGYSSTELFTQDEAEQIVLKAMDSAKAVQSDDVQFIYGKGDTYAALAEQENKMGTTPEYIDYALNLEAACHAKDQRVVTGTQGSVSEMSKTVSIYNSNGLELTNSNSMVVALASVVAEDNDQKYTGMSYQVKNNFAELNMDEIADEAVKRTVAQIGGSSVKSGEYKIVIDNMKMASMLSIFCDVFSAENVQKGLSLLKGKEGQKIASDIVTLIDDPMYDKSVVKSPFDAEGVATYKKNIIENGTLTTFMHNLKTAHKAGVKSTGNASKASYQSNVDISPYTFYLNPGDIDVKDLYKMVDNGILITEFKGEHAGANDVTGDFSLESKGFLIENGVITRPVEFITIAGNFFTMMKDIEAVASDLRFSYPSGSSIFGSPSVYIKSLSVAGN